MQPATPMTRTMRKMLRLFLEEDDGKLSGARMARMIRRTWPPYGAVTVGLMRLERTGWVTSRWGEGPKPRLRYYSLAPEAVELASALQAKPWRRHRP